MGYAFIALRIGDVRVKILIKADGGYRIGMGHIMRMLVLADAIKEFADVAFICRNNEEYKAGIKHISSCGYNVHVMDGSALFREMAKIGGNCLITDSYDVDEEYFDNTKRMFDFTGYMDDLNKQRINADFIINQNIYAGDLEYITRAGTRLFLGINYALLRKEFQKLPKRRTEEEIKNVMITLGGSDPGNLTGVITSMLSMAFPEVDFHIVVGPSFHDSEGLRKITDTNIKLHINPTMSELMLKCDAAVTACGSTVYELCACGTPAIGIITADNQEMVAGSMESLGLMKHAADPENVIQQLKSLDHSSRCRMSEMGQSMVDGCGSFRLAQEIKKIVLSKN